MRSYVATIHHDQGAPSHCRVDAGDRADAIKQARSYAKRIGVKPQRILAGLSAFGNCYARKDGK